jgi:hypothetical protein
MKPSLSLLGMVLSLLLTIVSTSSAEEFRIAGGKIVKESVTGEGGTQTFSNNSNDMKCTSVKSGPALQSFPTPALTPGTQFTNCTAPEGEMVGTCPNLAYGTKTISVGVCKFETVMPFCKFEIPEQTLPGVHYSNTSKGVDVQVAAANIHYTSTTGCLGLDREGTNLGWAGEQVLKASKGLLELK